MLLTHVSGRVPRALICTHTYTHPDASSSGACTRTNSNPAASSSLSSSFMERMWRESSGGHSQKAASKGQACRERVCVWADIKEPNSLDARSCIDI